MRQEADSRDEIR